MTTEQNSGYVISLHDIAMAELTEIGALARQMKEATVQMVLATQKLNALQGTSLTPMQPGGMNTVTAATGFAGRATGQAIYLASPGIAIAETKKAAGSADCKCCCATEIAAVVTAINNIAKVGYTALTQKEDGHCYCADEINKLLIPLDKLDGNVARLMSDIKGRLPDGTSLGSPDKSNDPDISKAIEALTKAINMLAGKQGGPISRGGANNSSLGYSSVPTAADYTDDSDAAKPKEDSGLGDFVKGKIMDAGFDAIKSGIAGEAVSVLGKANAVVGGVLLVNDILKATGVWKTTKEGYQTDMWDVIGTTKFAHNAEAAVTANTGTTFASLDKTTRYDLAGAAIAEGIFPAKMPVDVLAPTPTPPTVLDPTMVAFPDGKGGFTNAPSRISPYARMSTAHVFPYLPKAESYDEYLNSQVRAHWKEIAEKVHFRKDGGGDVNMDLYGLYHWGTKTEYTLAERKKLTKMHNMLYDHLPGGQAAYWTDLPAFSRITPQRGQGGGPPIINIYGGLIGTMNITANTAQQSADQIKKLALKAVLDAMNETGGSVTRH